MVSGCDLNSSWTPMSYDSVQQMSTRNCAVRTGPESWLSIYAPFINTVTPPPLPLSLPSSRSHLGHIAFSGAQCFLPLSSSVLF